MARNFLLSSINNFIRQFELLLFQHGPQPAWALVASEQRTNSQNTTFNLKDLLGNGLLWAVPKHRRSVEKRLNRKFGYPEYVWKPLKAKTNLRNCQQCGHDHEVGVLCPHCYDKVRKETQLIQEQIQENLGLEPVEQEIIVLYEGEKSDHPSETLNGKRIVELQKPRPMWFTKNLLQKTTQQPSETKEVKPSNLG